MWRNEHKRRVSAKGVARSGAYDVDIRGEIGRRSQTRPAYVVAEAINEALNPATAPGKVKRWQDMTEAERDALRRQYEKGPKR